MNFLERAQPFINLGIPVFPLSAGTKIPPPGFHFKEEATTNADTVQKWNDENPDYNVALLGRLDGFVFLEFDVKGGMKAAAEEMSQSVPNTRIQKSAGKGMGHYIFKQTERSRSIGNRSVNRDGGEWFSFRGNNKYLVGAGSFLTETGRAYETVKDVEPIDCPEWICDFVEKHSQPERPKPERSTSVAEDFDFDDLMEHYGIEIVGIKDNWHITAECPVAGYRHENSIWTGFYFDGDSLGFKCFAQGCEGSSLSIGGVLRHLNANHAPYKKNIWPREDEQDIDWTNVDDCEEVQAVSAPALIAEEVEAVSDPVVVEQPTISIDALEQMVAEQSGIKYPELRFPYEMLPEGRFRDLVDKACEGGVSPGLVVPALMTLVSAIPAYDVMCGTRINTYTCLLAMVGAGKDVSIDRARMTLGLNDNFNRKVFTDYTPAGEKVLAMMIGDTPTKKGSNDRNPGPKKHVLITREIEATLNKAKGDTSGVLQALQRLYDRNLDTFPDSKNMNTVTVDCRLSWLTALPIGDGEIDVEVFRSCFSERTTHGIVSRLWFGFSEERVDSRRLRHWIAPSGQVETKKEKITTDAGIDVEMEQLIDRSLMNELRAAMVTGYAPEVDAELDTWKPVKDYSGRDTFHIQKVCVLCAVLQGHQIVERSDWEFAKAFLDWQGRIRKTFNTGTAKSAQGGFNEVIVETTKRYTERRRKAGEDSKNMKVVDGQIFVRWKAMANDGKWYKYGPDVARTIDALVRGGALAFLVDTELREDGRDGKKQKDDKWIRLVGLSREFPATE